MREKDFPGGWYCDARPDGSYVVLIKDTRLDTHLGSVPLPFGGQNLLYVRCAPTGAFRFAGQLHNDGFNAEWTAHNPIRRALSRVKLDTLGSWKRLAPSYGVSPVIYSRQGVLHQNTLSSGVGSQGYRFVRLDDTIASGDSTYYYPEYRLNEYTILPSGVIIGQDNQTERGIIVYQGVRRVISGGRTRFIRASEEGDNLSIAIWREAQRDAYILWLSKTEISHLPLADIVVPPPPPPPPDGDTMEIEKNKVLNIRDELWNDPELTPKLMSNTAETKARTVRFLAHMVLTGHMRGLTRMGLLYKPGKGITADIITWRKNGAVNVADVLSGGDGIGGGGAHNHPPEKAWQLHGDMPDKWKHVTPGDDEFPDVDSGDMPIPEPATHRYVGGGNDTGECDECGQSRFSTVHAIPESKTSHTYDGGEQDTGLCDICQKVFDDVIHSGGMPPPPDTDEIVALRREVAAAQGMAQSALDEAARAHRRLDQLTTIPGPGPGDDSGLRARLDRVVQKLSQRRKTVGASGGLFGGTHTHDIEPLVSPDD